MQSTRVVILACVALLATATRTTTNHGQDSAMERSSSASNGLNQDKPGSQPLIETSHGKRKKREVEELQLSEDEENQKSKSRKRREPQLYPNDGSFGMRESRSEAVINENKESASPQYHFDGWYPIGSRDPMSDDPTVEYKPPAVDQVHFSDGPMPDKPLYPILPENPPVIVMRAEKNEPEINPVYGTENVEYFHINPQTKTVQAFKPNENGNPIQLIAAPQFGSSDETEDNSHNEENETRHVGYPGESSISNNFGEFDLDGEFSEHYYVATRPRSGMALASAAAPYSHLRGTPNQRSSNTRFDVVELFHDRSYRQPTTTTEETRLPLHARLRTSGFHESQIEEVPYEAAASDNSGSFRQVAAPQLFNKQQNPGRKSLSKTKYNRKRESTSSRPSTRPWFLIETTIDDHDKNREPSIASYIQPEHHRGDSKIYYKPYGPVAFVSKDEGNIPSHIHNPHLNDHMNSYKPTKSITASSLSELLQIFQFTAVTDDRETTTPRSFRYTRPTEESTTTRSADDALKLFATGYRYTASPMYDNVDSTTETSFTNTPSTENLKKPENIYDPVADTNSIDGDELEFSDSVDSHVYAQIENKPNKLILNSKDTNKRKSISKVSSTTARPLPTVVRPLPTVIRPLPTVEKIKREYVTESSRRPTFADVMLSNKKNKGSPLYVIYQGHSKVKVFGANNTPKKKGDKGSYMQVITTTPFSTTTNSPPSSLNTKSQSESTVFSSSPSTTPQSTSLNDSKTPSSVTITNQTLSTNFSSTSLVSTTLAPTETVNIATVTEEEEYKDPLMTGDTYDYYYDSDYDGNSFFPSEYTDHDDITIINFGGNYPKNNEDWVGHLNQPSYRRLPVDHPLQKLQTPPPSLESLLDSLPAASSFSSYPFQQKVHYSEGSASNEGNVFFPPALSSMDLDPKTVARPVFFTKRRSDGGETFIAKDAVLSEPFEYASQLRKVELDQQKPESLSPKVTTVNDSKIL